ncbi:hypothetical protein TCAL_00762 [Tigriopus californicus]|uniref:DC-UbP/UBTD2 N-terminal domain-containing protein n=1 Tax=Tigriopus californicus TaxID=6832 RepID=A0A553PCF5_TIGCA|nr:ubiquitin domain-containing protein 1-like [Tigriopus californicus]TRY75367.1 hypothetical protein TCAL_00762 [Tigriopus californicus]|eukprot:TCALIF_00762-PA protein Name:"Similar to ubtd2 Ubiquitin domain-containing protein 2 (Danio rerio)" AED:0.04 eAED:0.04 QI:0/-1/0/1/-1/1/1/0/212
MGNCLGLNRDLEALGGHEAHPSEPVGSRRGSTFSDSTSSAIHTHKNRPLRHEKIRWKSDIPLTDGQLKSKRDEFWDTAPAFDGKPEIWNALKAAAEAIEGPSEDFDLAQAILDGAGISLPHGSLVESYDELGTRYVIPVYCLSYPIDSKIGESARQRWFYGGRPLSDKTRVGEARVPPGHVIQCIVSDLTFDVIPSGKGSSKDGRKKSKKAD